MSDTVGYTKPSLYTIQKEETYMVTVQSIMNFGRGQDVEYYDNGVKIRATVRHVDLRSRTVFVKNPLEKDILEFHPGQLRILTNGTIKQFTDEERKIVYNNLDLSNRELGHLLNKSPGAIADFKCARGLTKTNHNNRPLQP